MDGAALITRVGHTRFEKPAIWTLHDTSGSPRDRRGCWPASLFPRANSCTAVYHTTAECHPNARVGINQIALDLAFSRKLVANGEHTRYMPGVLLSGGAMAA